MKTIFYLVIFMHLIFSLISCDSRKEDVIIYIVRHAEKNLADTSDNPALTQEGVDRANKLVEEMTDIKLDGIYSTEYDRNMNTIQPLANNRNISILTYDWYDYHNMLDEIKKENGKTYLICGHGDNILPMIEYLDGERPIEFLSKNEYDKLFQIIIREEVVSVEMTEY